MADTIAGQTVQAGVKYKERGIRILAVARTQVHLLTHHLTIHIPHPQSHAHRTHTFLAVAAPVTTDMSSKMEAVYLETIIAANSTG